MSTKRPEYLRAYRAKNRERLNEYNRIWRSKDPNRLAKRSTYYRARLEDPEYRAKKAERDRARSADPEQQTKKAIRDNARLSDPKQRARRTELHRINTYGLTSAEFDTKLASQDFKCANEGCRSNDPGHINGWCMDHCHVTGTVRGILCHHCNVALGNAKDCKRRLLGLVSYLDTYNNSESLS